MATMAISMPPETTNKSFEAGNHFMQKCGMQAACSPALKREVSPLQDMPVQPWDPERFQLVENLQQAPQNYGVVDLMQDIERGGCFVAVKRMPIKWTCSGPVEFNRCHPNAVEQPWLDIAIADFLRKMRYPYLCELLDVFRDRKHMYTVSSYATMGDMWWLIENGPTPGQAREAIMKPVMEQVFDAVGHLHRFGIVHRDVSMENVLLTCEEESGLLQVRLIDFGAASLSPMCSGVRGKSSYVAPEAFDRSLYNGFLADIFSIGVVLISSATCTFPWLSTCPGQCKMFAYLSKHGFHRFVKSRKIGGSSGTPFINVLSQPVVSLLEGLLDLDPNCRLLLDKDMTGQERGNSVWDSAWWQDSDFCERG